MASVRAGSSRSLLVVAAALMVAAVGLAWLQAWVLKVDWFHGGESIWVMVGILNVGSGAIAIVGAVREQMARGLATIAGLVGALLGLVGLTATVLSILSIDAPFPQWIYEITGFVFVWPGNYFTWWGAVGCVAAVFVVTLLFVVAAQRSPDSRVVPSDANTRTESEYMHDTAAVEPSLELPYRGAPYGAAWRRFWRKGLTFSGRASRAEYWRWTLLSLPMSVGLYLLGTILVATHSYPVAQFVNILWLVWALVTVIPSLALLVRRLHDTNRSGGYYFISWIPLVGGIILLVLTIEDSNPMGARFDKGAILANPYLPFGQPAAPVQFGYPNNAGYVQAIAPAAPVASSVGAHPLAPSQQLANPALDPQSLADIAYRHPELRATVAGHPNAYPGLIEWIRQNS
jgi:uncharacterized membrane protein YhaH (DUF805 family)